MRNIIRRSAVLLLCTLFAATLAAAAGGPVREVTRIDKGWQFHLGDVTGGEAVGFDDDGWRTLDVPHDWSIEGDYSQDAPTLRGGGYLPAGIGWYRKEISFPKADAKKRVYIEFQGVMANSDVWVNGKLAGHRPFGYLPLLYDITDMVTFDGKPNVVAVRADNTPQPASRWYTGAGIYRHVDIIKVDPVHLERYGVFVTTPEVSAQKATVSIKSSVENKSDKRQKITVQTTITSPTGKSLTTDKTEMTLEAGQIAGTEQFITVNDPEIWDIESPNLYTAYTTVSAGKKVLDDQTNTFGIRSIRFESETGFWLNGRNIKILGACAHHDGGPVGSAVPASVWERRLAALKSIGGNAIRGAHAPMNIELYELCDRMGVLYFDETFDTWTAAKPNGQKAYNLYFKEWYEFDARQSLLRARNHPCVILYSLGNEIRDNLNGEEGGKHFLRLKEITREVDPTRPITMALFRPVQMQLFTNGFSEMLDVIGQNYGEAGLLQAWAGKPGRKIIGTENTPSRSAWLAARDNPQFAGQFIWAGFDYLGEADWPKISWSEALFDRNAGAKHTTWERQSWWTTEPMVHIVRNDDSPRRGQTDDWTPTDPSEYKSANVTVYSNCEEVELFLNGVSLGKQNPPADDAPLQWNVEYAPGTLKAVGRNGGREVAQFQHVTASEPVKVELVAEKTTAKNDWDEVVYVHAVIVDKNGVRYPNSEHKVKFSISGPGEIVSVDNSDNFSHERYKANERTVYKGQALAIIRATGSNGDITLSASADGLQGSSVTLKAE